MKNLAIITASQAFDFPAEEIRLSYLSMPQLQAAIGQAFGFRASGITPPPQTFGPVEMTNPPGLVYEWGQWETEEGQFPIRLLAIENKRVVWQIAGAENEEIGALMHHLVSVCDKVKTLAEGADVLGKWKGTQWYSELSFTLDVEVDAFKRAMPILQIIDQALYHEIPKTQRTFPAITVFNYRSEEQFPGDVRQWHGSKFNLALRQGTTVDENTFYSAAPLRTKDHIALIKNIEAQLKTI